MSKIQELRDVTGFRGERIIELCLTEYESFPGPLFRPGFLGDKWPAIDFYVELTDVKAGRLFFFGQAKATATVLKPGSTLLHIATDRDDIERLIQIPAPTYVFGVHEPTKRVFARAVHANTPRKAITRIPIANELTTFNLLKLRDEVAEHWSQTSKKPTKSVFG